MIRLSLVALLILGVDQVTKLLASIFLKYGEPEPVFSMVALTLLHNAGAAFSFLSDAGGWQRWLFLILALGVTGFCLWSLVFEILNSWLKIGYVLLISGALGNAVDRAIFGHVVDFIHLHWGAWSFPAFNIADMSITFAGICLLIGWYVDARYRSKLQN